MELFPFLFVVNGSHSFDVENYFIYTDKYWINVEKRTFNLTQTAMKFLWVLHVKMSLTFRIFFKLSLVPFSFHRAGLNQQPLVAWIHFPNKKQSIKIALTSFLLCKSFPHSKFSTDFPMGPNPHFELITLFVKLKIFQSLKHPLNEWMNKKTSSEIHRMDVFFVDKMC